ITSRSSLHSDILILYIQCTLFFLFFFYCSRPHRDLHSFPTRRSSDLRVCSLHAARRRTISQFHPRLGRDHQYRRSDVVCRSDLRSEEHTSELQSLRHLVCRLLLEKKKES